MYLLPKSVFAVFCVCACDSVDKITPDIRNLLIFVYHEESRKMYIFYLPAITFDIAVLRFGKDAIVVLFLFLSSLSSSNAWKFIAFDHTFGSVGMRAVCWKPANERKLSAMCLAHKKLTWMCLHTTWVGKKRVSQPASQPSSQRRFENRK